MSTFDDRENAFENKYAHDAEMLFKAEARRNKLLGLWAAELLGSRERPDVLALEAAGRREHGQSSERMRGVDLAFRRSGFDACRLGEAGTVEGVAPGDRIPTLEDRRSMGADAPGEPALELTLCHPLLQLTAGVDDVGVDLIQHPSEP